MYSAFNRKISANFTFIVVLKNALRNLSLMNPSTLSHNLALSLKKCTILVAELRTIVEDRYSTKTLVSLCVIINKSTRHSIFMSLFRYYIQIFSQTFRGFKYNAIITFYVKIANIIIPYI